MENHVFGEVNVIVLRENKRRRRSRRLKSFDCHESRFLHRQPCHVRSLSLKETRLPRPRSPAGYSVNSRRSSIGEYSSSRSRTPSFRDNKLLIRGSHNSSRKVSSASCSVKQESNAVSVEVDVQFTEKERKRRRVAWVIIATFFFLLTLSVLAVIITLTHQSEVYRENKTTLVYTFAKPSDVIEAETALKNTDVRKENEELMHSLHGDSMGHQVTPQNSSPPTVTV